MTIFSPSGDFVNRVMNSVRAYESTAMRRADRIHALLFAKPAIVTLSAAGLLLGIWNGFRIALILLSPSTCR